MASQEFLNRLRRSRIDTLIALLQHFVLGNKIFMLPLVLLLLVCGVLLLLTTGLSYVAPFVYVLM